MPARCWAATAWCVASSSVACGRVMHPECLSFVRPLSGHMVAERQRTQWGGHAIPARTTCCAGGVEDGPGLLWGAINSTINQLGLLRSGAFKKDKPVDLLASCLREVSLDPLFKAGDGSEDGMGELAVAGDALVAPRHAPVDGRWEVSFLSLKSLPMPFYMPLENIVTLTRDGAMGIAAKMNLFGLEFPLGTFLILVNSTRAGTVAPTGAEGKSPLKVYGLQLMVDKPGSRRVFDLVMSKTEETPDPMMAVRSLDGEVAWLLSSVETRMKKRDANIRKFAKEIIDLELRGSKRGGRDGPSGYKVMMEVWRTVFKHMDKSLGTSLAESTFLLQVAPLFPWVVIAVFIALNVKPHFPSEMNSILF